MRVAQERLGERGVDAEVHSPVQHHGREGFLPIETNLFDRIFIGVVLFVAINLLWMRFVEDSVPLLVGALIAVVIGAVVVRKG